MSSPLSVSAESSLERWTISLFGPVTARHDSGPSARFETRRTAELLAYLAVNADKDHPREYLAELMWPEGDPRALRHRLTQALSALRKELQAGDANGPQVLTSDNHTIGLNSGAVAIDVAAFRQCLDAARRCQGRERADRLREAVELHRGEFAEGHYSDWVLQERTRLQDQLAEALTDLKAESEALGDLGTAIDCALRLAEFDPFEESHAFDVIRLLAMDGQAARALKYHRTFEEFLESEIGERPSTALSTLVQHIRGSQDSDLVRRATPDIAAEEPGAVLPARLTRFFGREEELRAAERLLREGTPILTLTGMAGAGKSRLAVEIAHQHHQQNRVPAWFVSLAETRRASEVPAAIWHVLKPDLVAGDSPIESIRALLGEQAGLIVLDNFDHLAEESSILHELRSRLANIRFLVTSRQRLNLEGEAELAVMPLSVPAETTALDDLLRSPAIQLFADRAQTSRGDFVVQEGNAEAVRALCARLDGIPLALELAASWSHALSPEQLLNEVNRRFDLLVSRRRDIPKRHRTLRAAIEQSYQSLTPDLQRFFTRISVFQGGFTLEAARAVCQHPESLSCLGQLVERSLVLAEEPQQTEVREICYRMLDTIREFGWEKLTGDQRAELSTRHADYYVNLALQAEPHLKGVGQAEWLDVVDISLQNIIAALRWCHQVEQYELGLSLASALGEFWKIRGPRPDGIEWLSTFLQDGASDVSARTRARGLAALGHLTWSQSQFEAAEAAHRECLAIQEQIDDKAGIAHSLYYLGIICVRRAAFEEARSLMESCLSQASELGDRACMARAMLNLGNLAKYGGNFAAAREYYEQCLEIEQTLGNNERVAITLNNLGTLALTERKWGVAEVYLTESLKISDALLNRESAAIVTLNLGKLCERTGRHQEAGAHLLNAFSAHQKVGSMFFARECLVELAKVATNMNELEVAAMMIERADMVTKAIKVPMPPQDEEIYHQALEVLTTRLDPQEFESHRAKAAASGLDEVLAQFRNIYSKQAL